MRLEYTVFLIISRCVPLKLKSVRFVNQWIYFPSEDNIVVVKPFFLPYQTVSSPNTISISLRFHDTHDSEPRSQLNSVRAGVQVISNPVQDIHEQCRVVLGIRWRTSNPLREAMPPNTQFRLWEIEILCFPICSNVRKPYSNHEDHGVRG